MALDCSTALPDASAQYLGTWDSSSGNSSTGVGKYMYVYIYIYIYILKLSPRTRLAIVPKRESGKFVLRVMQGSNQSLSPVCSHSTFRIPFKGNLHYHSM